MTRSLGLLPADPTQERILLEVISNPHGVAEQVMFCIDVATVTPGTEFCCDGDAWLYEHCANDLFGRFPGEWQKVTYRGPSYIQGERLELIEAAKANGTYRPTLRELLWTEERQNNRRNRNAEWMRKQRAQNKQDRPTASCAHCGATFTPKRSTAQFCSTACRVASHRAQGGIESSSFTVTRDFWLQPPQAEQMLQS